MRDITETKRPLLQRTALDRVIGYFSPRSELDRLRARLGVSIINQYAGADRSKRSMANWGWKTRGNSADADTLFDLPVLRDRSNDLVRNNPLASGAIGTNVAHIVGTGLTLQSRIDTSVLGMSEEQGQEWQSITELEWRMWCERPENCDACARLTFYGLQSLALRSALESGDVFAVLPMRRYRNQAYALKVQLVEAHRVVNKNNLQDTRDLAGGVEMDRNGRPIAYHILKEHPGSLRMISREWDIVPAIGQASGRRNVIHLYEMLRPGQTRGVPYLAPVIEALKQLGEYSQAELDAAVVASFIALFIESESGAGFDPTVSAATGDYTPTGDVQKGSAWDGSLSPGLVAQLPAGTKVTSPNLGRPNASFEPFVNAFVRYVGVGLGLPYEVLIKHFQSSYSASRAALLDAWHFWKVRREWLACCFCQPVYEEFLAEAISLGRISAPGFFDDPLIRHAYSQAQWQGDGPGAIDPLKEASAAEKRLQIGLTTLAEECVAYDGSDWETKHTQQVKEHDMREEAGLMMQQQTAPNTQQQQMMMEDGDDEDAQ